MEFLKVDPFSGIFPTRLIDQLETLRQIKSTDTYERFKHLPWVPIEAFKLQPTLMAPVRPISRIFRSSGTTSDQRSRVAFSVLGMGLYRIGSIHAFYHVLKQFFPQPELVQGIRFIPPSSEWPDSSLAQMLDWIEHVFSVKHLSVEKGLPTISRESPVWIFGTAFHFVNLYDQGYRTSLPKGSVVFETGGTKGLSREVDRYELFHIISEMLGVSQNFIVSEYGMAELASQAYDFVQDPYREKVDLENRHYRFPSWVQLNVQVPKIVKNASLSPNVGALIVDDLLRIDSHAPIRTQDLARLNQDLSFQLKGRVIAAPLKGCSLLVNQTSSLKLAKPNKIALEWFDIEPEKVRKRVFEIWPSFQKAFKDSSSIETLSQVFTKPMIAKWAYEDLLQSLPKSPEDLITAGLRSIKHCQTVKRWLILGPSTHPIAVLHPLLIGASLGLDLTLKLSRTASEFELWYTDLLNSTGANIKVVPPQTRLCPNDSDNWDGLMVFGSNETIENLAKTWNGILSGFGNYTSIAVLTDKLKWQKQVPLLIKDAFSLGQKGCMSVRAAIFVDELSDDLKIWSSRISQYFEESLPSIDLKLSFEEQLAIDHEILRIELLLSKNKFHAKQLSNGILLSFYHFESHKKLDDYLSPTPFTIPIVRVPSQRQTEFIAWLEQNPSIKKLMGTLSDLPRSTRFEYEALGRANIVAWDGNHERRPLFSHWSNTHEDSHD